MPQETSEENQHNMQHSIEIFCLNIGHITILYHYCMLYSGGFTSDILQKLMADVGALHSELAGAFVDFRTLF